MNGAQEAPHMRAAAEISIVTPIIARRRARLPSNISTVARIVLIY